MRLERLLAITIMLINRRRVTAPDLAEHFGVSIRTIYRDIDAIKAADIPVVSVPGYDGGFKIMDNYRITRQLLTFDDMVSVITTLRGINQTLNSADLSSAIEKIECLVPEEREAEFARRSELLAFDAVPWSFVKRQEEHLAALYEYAFSRWMVSFVYTDYYANESRRTVEPMTLVFKSNCWYLFGYCLVKNDFRIFRLSRIRDLAPTGASFIRREGSWKSVLSDPPQPKKPTLLTLRFAPHTRVKIEDCFESNQLEIQPDGMIIVTCEFDDDAWIYPWLLSFADEVEVVAPAVIRESFLALLGKIRKKYIP